MPISASEPSSPGPRGRSIRALALAVPCMLPGAAATTPSTTLAEWRTFATTASVHCSINVFSCGFLSDVNLFPLIVEPSNGGENLLSAVAQPSDPAAGTATAQVDVIGALSAPEIRVTAVSNPDYWMQGNGMAI